MKKVFVATTLAVFALLFFMGTALAQTSLGISFGIRPTQAKEDQPETFSYFYHSLAPGVVFEDEALVMNDSDQPLALKLYAADGISAENGGTTFTKQGESANGVGQWLSPPELEIHLGPQQEWVVPFTISVPEDAAPGQYVAGLVVEAVPEQSQAVDGGSQAQFVVSVVRRVGVAVVVEVPGEQVAALEVTDVSLEQQDERGATFRVAIHNSGNIYVQGEGELQLTTTSGDELAVFPLTVDTILPGDTADFLVSQPVQLSDSDYLANVRVEYEGKTAQLNDVLVAVRQGQLAAQGQAGEADQQPFITKLIPGSPTASGSDGSGLPLGWLVGVVIGLIILLAGAGLLLMRRDQATEAG